MTSRRMAAIMGAGGVTESGLFPSPLLHISSSFSR
jgi:hypothetical protein